MEEKGEEDQACGRGKPAVRGKAHRVSAVREPRPNRLPSTQGRVERWMIGGCGCCRAVVAAPPPRGAAVGPGRGAGLPFCAAAGTSGPAPLCHHTHTDAPRRQSSASGCEKGVTQEKQAGPCAADRQGPGCSERERLALPPVWLLCRTRTEDRARSALLRGFPKHRGGREQPGKANRVWDLLSVEGAERVTGSIGPNTGPDRAKRTPGMELGMAWRALVLTVGVGQAHKHNVNLF